MIELKNISKKFKKSKNEILALSDINIKFELGKFYAIMGCSGSGKSTLLNIIGLLDKPTSGILYLNNVNTSSLNEKSKNLIRLKEIGYVFQECYLIDNLTVYENIMLPLLINKNISKENKKIIVNDLLKKINLIERANHFPKELSGGEKQRVAVARSLVNNPRIILADEPTGNLDKKNEEVIFNLFRDLANTDKCVIVVSHSELIKRFADDIIYMTNGTVGGESNDI